MSEDSLKLFYCNLHNVIDETRRTGAVPKHLSDRVDSFRREKAEHFRMLPDKVRSYAAGALIHEALRDYLRTSGSDEPFSGGIPELKYGNEENGKPYLVDYPDFHFSLSHSGDYAALVYSDKPVGVDVQEERGKADTDSIAGRFFSSYENELLGSIEDENERRHMFYRIWAAKEAYIKMTGMGLREELSDFSVSLEEMIIRQGHPEETSGYIREPLPLTGNVLTVCFGEPIRKLYIEEIFF